MVLADRWNGLFVMDVGSSVCGGRAIGAVAFGCPAATRTTDAGIVIALAGRRHPPVFVGKRSFKLEKT